jgi:hypothetical protein
MRELMESRPNVYFADIGRMFDWAIGTYTAFVVRYQHEYPGALADDAPIPSFGVADGDYSFIMPPCTDTDILELQARIEERGVHITEVLGASLNAEAYWSLVKSLNGQLNYVRQAFNLRSELRARIRGNYTFTHAVSEVVERPSDTPGEHYGTSQAKSTRNAVVRQCSDGDAEQDVGAGATRAWVDDEVLMSFLYD